MDKTIRRIKLSTEKDENGSFYSIIFENKNALVRFHDGRTGTQRYIHQSFPKGLENLAQIFNEIDDFGCGVAVSLFFDGIEYDDANELKFFLGEEAFETLKSEVEAYSAALDLFMAAFPRTL